MATAPHMTLKPCPFCGGDAYFGVVGIDGGDEDDPNFGGRYIQCDTCNASTMLMFPLKESVDQALADAWNARHPC